nr:hypothetical protein [Tanacetum cinerariifolium]
MDTTIDQQVAVDEALATANVNHHAIRFKMDNKKHIVNLESFRDILHICPRVPDQSFVKALFEEEILAFIHFLRHSAVEQKDSKKSNEMYYLRFTKVIIHHFMSKDPFIPRRNKVNWHYVKDDHMFSTIKLVSRHQNTQQFGALLPIELTNEETRNSNAYKEYYSVATGAAPPTTKARESDFYSEEIENYLNDDSIPIGVKNSVFDPEGGILFLERLLSEEPRQLHPMNPNHAKSSIEEPEYSFGMGYEHFSTTLITELDEVAKSSIKNLVPIPHEYEVTSDNERESNDPVKDDSTTFSNPLFNDSDDSTNDEDVPIEESKVHSNQLFDNDEINSDELESHVESNFVKSLSNHDTLKFDHLEEFSGPLLPTHIAEEERIRREHAEYISRMEMLFTINPHPHPTVNANTIVESFPSSLIPVQDNVSQREEVDIVTNMDELLPPGFENDDSEEEIDVVEELHVDNSIYNFENELSDNEESDFDNPSFPRPPLEPPDDEFDFELDAREEISVLMNDELECLDPTDEIDENDDYFPFMFVI